MQWIHMQTRHLTIAVAIALSAASAHAAETTDATADAALSAQTLDTVSVIGQGETRQVQRITAVDKQVLPPGTSGQKILDRLPGVSVQSNDAFGANEESQTISLRGFDKSRLGYTLDGIPLGDNSYGNYNGLSIARALIAENLAGAELSQGIGSLGVASTSNLGGTIQYFSMDPSTEFGGRASVTVGDNNQRRGYLRVDTGDINDFSAYVSGVHQDQDMWAAPYQNQTTRQFNAKAVLNVGDHRFGAFVATSRASQANYAYLSKDMLDRGLGWDWNIYAPDWDRAVAAAYCAPGTRDPAKCQFSGGVNSIDDAYYQSRALRDDNLYSVDADLRLGEQGRLKLVAYHHDNRGQGHWWAPGQPSYPGTDQMLPISIRSTNYTINRDGLTAALSWQVGIHELEAGLWYEQNDHNVSRNFYYISGPFLDDLYLKNPDRLLFNQDFDIRTQQFYVQDRMRFLDQRLTVDVGLKSPNTRMRATAKGGGGNQHRLGHADRQGIGAAAGRPGLQAQCEQRAVRIVCREHRGLRRWRQRWPAAGLAGIVRGQRRAGAGEVQELGSRLPYLRRELPGVHRRLQRDLRQPPAVAQPVLEHRSRHAPGVRHPLHQRGFG